MITAINISCIRNIENYTELISKVERIPKDSWVNYKQSDPLPESDIILWANCDLATNLKRIHELTKLLKPGGRAYFEYDQHTFRQLINKCISRDDSITLFGDNNDEKVDIQKLLELLVNDPQLSIANIRYGNIYFIVVTRINLNFKPTTDLIKEFEAFDNAIVEPSPELAQAPEIIEPTTELAQASEIIIEPTPELAQAPTSAILPPPPPEYPPPPDIPVIRIGPQDKWYGFANKDNSCFMDSILFPMLLFDNPAFDQLLGKLNIDTIIETSSCTGITDKRKRLEFLRKFRNTMRNLKHAIVNNKNPEQTCDPILSQLQKCGMVLTAGEQGDDAEFLMRILDMYSITTTAVNTIRRVSNDSQTWTTVNDTFSKETILEVQPNENANVLDTYQSITIRDYARVSEDKWPVHNGIYYRYEGTARRIDFATMLIFHVDRLDFINGTVVRNTTRVHFTEKIINQLNWVYVLSIVTVHIGDANAGHYISLFRAGDIWYEYNDLHDSDNRIREISIAQVLNDYSDRISLLLYTVKNSSGINNTEIIQYYKDNTQNYI